MNTKVKNHLDLLGHTVEDRVTKLQGTVTSICFDLFGCIQAAVHPGLDGEGKQRESHWYDVNRLKILSTEPVMDRPNFDFGPVADGDHGPAEKPMMRQGPL